MEDLVDCLQHWAQIQPEKTLFSFLDGQGQLREQYTYRQFYERALGLAQRLEQQAEPQYGDRVLLVYPPGLEMIVAFFALVNLGVIPVPVSPPIAMTSDAGIERIEHIVRDCEARLALTTTFYLSALQEAPTPDERAAETKRLLESLRWLATDAIFEPGSQLTQGVQPERGQPNPILFLQYTSGSTGDPKGVIVTHRNVLHNAPLLLQHCPVGVSWLPQYHDMGLVGHYFFILVMGGTNYGFSPFDFLRRPARWLQLVSQVRATVTCAPNFAFSYCLREDKVSEAELQGVDLSSLRKMATAAEPVHAETYAHFFERFARYGLPRESYEAGYGLAENTLGVSDRGRQILTLQKQRLQRRQVCIHKTMARNNNHVSLVSCGRPYFSIDVRIVDPESCLALGSDAIGEIWVDGESKCAGYWQRPELTQAVFNARIKGEPDNPHRYLRTGDLGFLHEGELVVCGRIKDMIIIHGTNYYPQDIEAIVETEFQRISPGRPVRTVAFALDQEGEERLVVAVEVHPGQDGVDPAAIARDIRGRYFIEPYQVIFVAPRAIPKTTSGKLCRSKTRDRWLRGTLPVLASYVQADSLREDATSLRGLFNRFRELYRLSGEEEVTLADIGLDSLALVELTLGIQHYFEGHGLGHLVSELDARFLQRVTVAELSRLLETYETNPESETAALRTWLEARQKADDAHERQLMQADAQWYPPTDRPTEGRANPQSILMTGASGFFGPFLLGSLLERTTCAIQVLIRATDPSHGQARIVNALRRAEVWTPELEERFLSRVRVLCGDLGLNQFGLSHEQWERLAEEIDAVVHAGAWVNYVLSYDALRPYNVGGTRELLRLAATGRKKSFHLISSTFVHGWSTSPVALEHDYNEDIEEVDFGYAQSKWVAEHLVRNAEQHGLPVRIYRPAFISASSRGVGSKEDIAVRLLGFMIKYGLGIEALNQVSFLPADLVSDHIARVFLLRDTTSTAFHVTTTQYYNIMDVTKSISEQFGYSFTYSSIPRFIERMNQLCTPDDPLYPLLVFANRSYQKFEPMAHKRYDNRHYRAALSRVKPEILEPRLSETVAYIVKHLQREGLIPAPGSSVRAAKPEPSSLGVAGSF